jgi:hypothetical protein
MSLMEDYSAGLLGRRNVLVLPNTADSPKTFPASAIHPELNAEEVRSKEIERIARMLCIQIEGSDCCDCEVSMWGELQRSATGKWILPPPEARCKLWQLYRYAANAVYEDQQKAKP